MADLKPSSDISFVEIFLCSAFAACFAEVFPSSHCIFPLIFCFCLKTLLPLVLCLFCLHWLEKCMLSLSWLEIINVTQFQGNLFRILIGRVVSIYLSMALLIWVLQFCTIPLDTAKVRLQLQRKTFASEGVSLPKYRGLLGTVATIAREEGLAALWKGITAGLHRQFIYGGLRIGLYEPVCLGCSPSIHGI